MSRMFAETGIVCILSVVIVAMQCCVQTSLLLLRSGFPLLDFLECLENNMDPLSNFPATCNIAALLVNGPDFVGTDGVLKCLPQIPGSLSTSLSRLVAPIVVNDWHAYLTVCRTSAVDKMVLQWLLRAMDNVWLWYFTSLPQKPFRYTCRRWKTHLDRSLGHVQMIQKRSHTFLLNSSVETYYGATPSMWTFKIFKMGFQKFATRGFVDTTPTTK